MPGEPCHATNDYEVWDVQLRIPECRCCIRTYSRNPGRDLDVAHQKHADIRQSRLLPIEGSTWLGGSVGNESTRNEEWSLYMISEVWSRS